MRSILLNPGPVNTTRSVRSALSRQDICHREPEFEQLQRSICNQLERIFSIKGTHTPVLISTSGTGAVEAMLACLRSPVKKKVLVLSNGVYGQRLHQILQAHRIDHQLLSANLGDFPSLERVEKHVQDENIHAVAMVHHETSCGMLNPLKEVAKIAKKHKRLMIVDAVSSLGAEEVPFEHLDFVAGSAGKCLHAYPGVSMVFCSSQAKAWLQNSRISSHYLDLRLLLQSMEKGAPAFTPAVQLYYALDQALMELQKQGLQKRIKQYRILSEAFAKAHTDLGIKHVIGSQKRSHVLSALWLPMSLNYTQLHDELKKLGFVIYAGQSELAGKIFRVSNLGEIALSDIRRYHQSLRRILKKYA